MVIVRGKNVYTTSESDKLINDLSVKLIALTKEVEYVKRELKRLSKPVEVVKTAVVEVSLWNKFLKLIKLG